MTSWYTLPDMQNTFICLLPAKEINLELEKNVFEISHINESALIKLPLHVTLYFFPESNHKLHEEIINWIDSTSQKKKGAIQADVVNLGNFEKNGEIHVWVSTS